MIIIIRALPQRGKDDGDYDSPTSRDETPDFMKNKRGQRSPNKKRGQISPPKRKKEKKEKKKKAEEKGQCYYPFTTLVLQGSTMFFI